MKAAPASVETLSFSCRQCGALIQIKLPHRQIVEILSQAMETTAMSSVIEAGLKMKKPGSSY